MLTPVLTRMANSLEVLLLVFNIYAHVHFIIKTCHNNNMITNLTNKQI